MKREHTPGPWHKHDPNKEGSYICRMKNGYIKMCHWDTNEWTDMWETTLDGEVKEWMTIPGDELPVDPNARLMAAAPELLLLLKAFVANGLDTPEFEFARDMTQETIAKIEGDE